MRRSARGYSWLTATIVAGCVAATVSAGVHAGQSARRRLARIAKTDRAKHEDEWKRQWKNPRVLVDRDDVYVLVGGAGLGEGSKPAVDVAETLAALPRSAWPHGRIVALTRTARLTDESRFERVRALLSDLGVETIETPVGCACGT